jgi:DNA-nicking Smr family endonuclease
MSADDDSLFRQEMTGVTPLKREPRVNTRAASGRDTSLARRRAAAVSEPQADRNNLSDTGITPLDAWYTLEFKRPGVQNGVFRKLKQGRYEPQARLDLHRMSVERARREIFEFVEESYSLGLRSLLVIHGKGQSSAAERERSSILKGGVDRWLRELDHVQAFHSAQPQHGGTGAAYVLLRKSDDAKRETREQFTKGRVPAD